MTVVTLRVRDLATIADVTLELGPGLNVLTGETGAGKSMLVDALALLLGDRADRAAIRPGAAKAVVEGVIEAVPPATRSRLEDAGVDAAESLIIRREVTTEGRSRAWLNGSPTTIRPRPRQLPQRPAQAPATNVCRVKSPSSKVP